jgi:lantibiotic modifying enzyme
MKQITHEEMKNYCQSYTDYITQQEKKEKLLELYRQYYQLWELPITIDIDEFCKKVISLPNQIKAIEEEMK